MKQTINIKNRATGTKLPSALQNLTTIAKGTIHIDYDDYYDDSDPDDHTFIKVTYGFKNVQFWIPAKQQWVSTPEDKFLVTANSLELARTEFWTRWSIYCKARFGYNYIKLERI